jgi:hypothetical protein
MDDVIEECRKAGVASELLKFLALWFERQKSYKVCVDPGNESQEFFTKNIRLET